MQRREFISGGLAAIFLASPALTVAKSALKPVLQRFALSPWLTNGIAVAADGSCFLNFPRFQGHLNSPSLARITVTGPVAFPDNHWNQWQPGDDGVNTLVNVNACHIFDDNLLWVVDQGAPEGEKPGPGAAKLLAFDLTSGEVKKLIRFDKTSLPEGGAPNDLRIHGPLIYVTDSGLGGIIIHDLASGQTIRRLSASSLLRKPENAVQRGFNGSILQDASHKKPEVHSDVIEVTSDGIWLYYATPTGPLYRIRTSMLLDGALTDEMLEKNLNKIADIPSIGGSAIDDGGNLYLSNVEKRSIDRLKPEGIWETLIEDDRLITPDALVIDSNGWLYIPAPQIEYISTNNNGKDKTQSPWSVYRLRVPV